MTDRPIIFSAPMVRALLAGTKTQTRRIATSPLRRCAVGDRLYVRESMYLWSAGHDCEITFSADGHAWQTGPNTGRIPDDALAKYFSMVDQSRDRRGRVSRPSIHMPRWASRLTLIVQDVRVEPLQAITLGDICAEGLAASIYEFKPVQRGFDAWVNLWSSLHTKPGERWDDNPDVLALTFRVERGNIDRISHG